MATFKKVYDVIIDKIEDGKQTMMETALDFLHGFDFSECETKEENIEYYQYIEKYGNVSMYYDFGSDYYFFVEE